MLGARGFWWVARYRESALRNQWDGCSAQDQGAVAGWDLVAGWALVAVWDLVAGCNLQVARWPEANLAGQAWSEQVDSRSGLTPWGLTESGPTDRGPTRWRLTRRDLSGL